jgi:murein DD-endopeptidase MepM/ murein hydrolase activator NlpD
MAQLQLLASEVSIAYGIRDDRKQAASLDGLPDTRLTPTMSETLEQYNLLKSASLSTFSRGYSRRWLVNTTPSIWPVTGRLMSHFGHRDDPFSGHQAFHTGVDISVPVGTPVRVTADGIVRTAEWFGAYGRLIVVDHGNGRSTYYAHLARIDVISGQEVRTGQIIGASGASGRVTAPHLHYEVRVGGSPMNPYPSLAKSGVLQTPASGKLNFGL